LPQIWTIKIPGCPSTPELELGRRTLIMGVLNVTPDSFSDGGRHFSYEDAVNGALRMVEQGADIIDIGGESTRPGSDPVTIEDELRRVLPVIESVAPKIDAPVSIDTYKSRVAREALGAGASMVNDISGLRFDPEMPRVVAESGAPVAVMHIKGTPKDMQKNPQYADLIGEIIEYLEGSIEIASRAGVDREQIIVDPGIGFGKSHVQNLEIIRNLPAFRHLDRPVLMGVSRKAFIGTFTGGRPVTDRLMGSAAAVAASIIYGAHIMRVHDVAQMKEVVMITDAIREAANSSGI
jgi:dihydropteroate synthase